MKQSKKTQPYKKPYPLERYLQRVRDFKILSGRVPTAYECGQSTNKHLLKKFGTWDAVLQHLFGVKGLKHRWTRDEVGEIIKKKYAELGRLPIVRNFTKAELKLITVHLSNLTIGCEEYLGNSVRLELLRIVERLTPPGCDNATTQEIGTEINRTTYDLNMYEVKGLLDFSVRQKLLQQGRYDRTTWWSLTSEGRKFIQQFKGEKNGKDRTR